MMTELFPAFVCRSKRGKHPLLIHRLSTDPAKCFKFEFKKDAKKGTDHYYNCSTCVSLKKQNAELSENVVRVIRVSRDYSHFCSNPEELDHFCTNYDGTIEFEKIEVEQIYRNVVADIKANPIKPSQADSKVIKKINDRFGNDSSSAVLKLPSKSSRKRVFQLARKTTRPEDIDPMNIPELLVKSKIVVANQESYIVRYFRQIEPPFVFLADRINLKSMFDARVLVMDGTFDYRPNGFDQTYTIHSVFSELPNRQSSFLSGIAFLPGRDTNIYTKLFSELRTALMDEFDEIGNAKTVLMDCELAAQNALEIVFPEWSVRSCSFHFAKNVLDYAKNNGLSETLENSEFAVWTKEILGCIFLPELYMNEVFAYLLDSPPFNDKHVKKFVKYLRNYWSKKLHKLCVWENNYPRTTNIAEGYNNGLQTSFEHETHPAFRKAFDVHVDDLNKNAYDYLRLQDGVDRLCLRKPIARKVDENLMEARIKLADYLTKLHENDDTISIEDLLQYCRHVRYLSSTAKYGYSEKHPDAKLLFEHELGEEFVPKIPTVAINYEPKPLPPRGRVNADSKPSLRSKRRPKNKKND